MHPASGYTVETPHLLAFLRVTLSLSMTVLSSCWHRKVLEGRHHVMVALDSLPGASSVLCHDRSSVMLIEWEVEPRKGAQGWWV